MIRSKFAVGLMIFVAACGGSSEEEIADRLEDKGTMELMDEASEDEYISPEDNRLTEGQIEMYMKVREREAAIAEVSRKQLEQDSKAAEENKEGVKGFMAGMKSLGSVADLLTADIRAAQELGYNTAEYQWVKERVLEASGDALREQWANQMNGELDKQYADAKAALEAAKTDEEKQLYAQILQGVEEMKAASAGEEQDPWIAYNRGLLEKHEDALKALEMELAKFHGEPEAQEMVEQARVQ